MPCPPNDQDEPVAPEATDTEKFFAENARLRDELLRALAEAENSGRRAERAIEEARKFAISGFARELLLGLDNLRRTVAAAEQQMPTAENVALVEGVQATLRILTQTLERFDVQRIEALGQKFDPSVHEAVATVEDHSRPPGIVSRVMEDGYMINDRLLRPARVAVSALPSGPNSAPG
jgi:molecular chaperone GrpE